MNKQQLASKIWESANKMRSKIEANEYKDYILGFMFYKFLSDKEVKWLKENDWTDEYLPDLTEDDVETLDTVRKNVGYFIAYENLFSTWISKGSDFKADDVTVALQAFSRLIDIVHINNKNTAPTVHILTYSFFSSVYRRCTGSPITLK